MIEITCYCHENMNHYEENIEVDVDENETDEVIEKAINEAYSEWVWNEIGDRFSWERTEVKNGE